MFSMAASCHVAFCRKWNMTTATVAAALYMYVLVHQIWLTCQRWPSYGDLNFWGYDPSLHCSSPDFGGCDLSLPCRPCIGSQIFTAVTPASPYRSPWAAVFYVPTSSTRIIRCWSVVAGWVDAERLRCHRRCWSTSSSELIGNQLSFTQLIWPWCRITLRTLHNT